MTVSALPATAILAIGLGVALSMVLPTTPANAAPAPVGETVAVSLGAGHGGGAELSVPLFLEPTIVPGDEEQRTIVVTNDGAEQGTLVAQLVNVNLAGDTTDPYYTDLLLAGHPVSALYGQDTELARVALAPGKSTTLDIAYLFPEGSTNGNYSQLGTVRVSFDVLLTMSGDLPGNPDTPRPPLAITGIGGAMPGIAAAGLLAAIGLGALIAARRRRSIQ